MRARRSSAPYAVCAFGLPTRAPRLALCSAVVYYRLHCRPTLLLLQGLAAPLVPLRFRCPTLYLLPRRTCVPRDLSSTATSCSQQHYFFMRCPGRGPPGNAFGQDCSLFPCTARRQVKPLSSTCSTTTNIPLYGCCQLHAATAPASVVCLCRPGAAAKATSSEPAGLLEASKVRLEWKWWKMRKNLGHFAMPALRSVCTCDLSLSLVSQRHAKLHKKFHWRRRMVDGWPACIHYQELNCVHWTLCV